MGRDEQGAMATKSLVAKKAKLLDMSTVMLGLSAIQEENITSPYFEQRGWLEPSCALGGGGQQLPVYLMGD